MKIMAELYANGVYGQGLYIAHNRLVREFFRLDGINVPVELRVIELRVRPLPYTVN